ncbi:MAG: hypothetical protein K0R18_2663 [Bacillales bacterium]|jgi:hypothetical protein|nr:hypothetical protein [Bacillales bacterium]
MMFLVTFSSVGRYIKNPLAGLVELDDNFSLHSLKEAAGCSRFPRQYAQSACLKDTGARCGNPYGWG